MHRVQITNVIVFQSDGVICWARTNCPGSWHDAVTSTPLYTKLRSETAGYCILADTAFPRVGDMKDRIVTGLKDGDLAGFTSSQRKRAIRKHRVVTSLRQAVEWGMRFLKSSFRRLTVPLPVSNAKTKRIVDLCIRLANRTRTVGLNQIATTFSPHWHLPLLVEPNYDRIARFYQVEEAEYDVDGTDP